MIFALSFGILFPAILLVVAFNVSGFSYRTSGKMCIINHENSFTVFWTWIITLAVSSFLLQAFTSGYCLFVFLRGQRTMGTYDTSSITNTKARRKRIGRASMMAVLGLQARGSAHLQTDALNVSAFRQRWNQIKAVVQSQWRIASLSVAFASQSAPFVVHFVKSRTHSKTQKLTACFLKYGMEDQRCLDRKAVLTAGQTTIMAGMTIAAVSSFIVPIDTSLMVLDCRNRMLYPHDSNIHPHHLVLHLQEPNPDYSPRTVSRHRRHQAAERRRERRLEPSKLAQSKYGRRLDDRPRTPPRTQELQPGRQFQIPRKFAVPARRVCAHLNLSYQLAKIEQAAIENEQPHYTFQTSQSKTFLRRC